MWKLKNKLFGFHYVLYKDSCTQFIARVEKLPNGEIFMHGGFCRGHYSSLLGKDGKLINGRNYVPLTLTQEQINQILESNNE